MPNIMNQELVRAFNVILCHNEVAITNLTVQSTDQTFFKKEDRIVISFDKSMDVGQCMEYLRNIKESIVETFCGSESGANISFNTQFFPFNFNERQLTKGKEGYKFSVPMDKGVVFNLKCLLAHGLAKDAKEDMGNEFGERCMEGRVYDVSFDRKSYLYCMRFYDKKLQDYFVESFSSRVKNYRNGPKRTDDFLKIKGNSVYIKGSIFNNAEFIKDIVKHKASLECRDFEVTSAEDETVESLKFPVIDLSCKVGIPINSVLHVSYTGSGENSVLIPAAKEVIGNIIYYKFLSKEQADDINKVFGMTVLNNVEDCTSPKHLPVSGGSGIYGIDFADPDISYCVLNKIMESSVINERHELSIDPELRLRALSPPGTPPNQRKADSGYDSNSPLQLKDSGSSSGGPGPSSKMSQTQLEFPMRSQDGALEDSPRRGSEQGSETEKEGLPLHNHVNSAGTSKGSWSSQGTSGNKWMPSRQFTEPGPSGLSCSQSGASSWKGNPVVANPWSQQTNPCLSQGTSENKWMPSRQFTEPGPSGLSCSQSGASSSRGANPVGAQPMGAWALPASSAGFSSWSQSEPSSSRGAGKNMLTGSSSWCLPPSTSSLTTRNDPISSNLGIFADPPEDTENICSMKEKQQVTKEKEEEKLSKALLYTLNLMNYTLDGVYTNFFAKDGKIVSLLHDNVDRKKYFQAVRAYIIEKYCGTEEEARKVYDLDEFPFKLNCEEKQGKTVVANISRGALSNLKILFSQKFGKNVDAIDISAVKEIENREKDEWVDRQRSYGASLQDACESCFPDEGPMKIIPIALEGDEYVLDRSREECEVKLLLREQKLRLRGTLVNEEEKELFKALLYAFNYSNNNFDLPDTNFIVKNGKIASLIPDSVNVKEYLQEVRDKTKKGYCKDKKEAYDLDEFPFKFLSNCEKNQETTVVANISRGALFNLKKLFIYGYKKKAETGDIDINTVEEAVKSKKDELVNSKVKGIERKGGYHSRIEPDEAATASYPDESALEYIPIEKHEAGYYLNRAYCGWETKFFVENSEYTKGTSKAKKMKSEDNKDSGISSGEATDAENVSSKAEGKTSGYKSIDCENPPTSDQKSTRRGSPKRKSQSPVGGDSPAKRSLPHPGLSGPTLEQVREQLSKTGI